MQVKERKHAQGRSFEMQFDPKNMLVLVMRNDEDPSFAIGWLHDGRWCYQSLMWSCRGGKQFWYRPLITFYRYIRKNKITDHSLRYMAWGESRLKHGGYVYGSESHQLLQRIGERLAASRQREAAVAAGIKDAIMGLNLGDRWSLEVRHNDFYVINERTRAAGLVTECITIKAVFDCIHVQRITGISYCVDDADPFRNMRKRNEESLTRIADQDRSPEQLVESAMTEVEQLMATRSNAAWAANYMLAA